MFLFVVSIFSVWTNTKVNAAPNIEEKLLTTTMNNYLEYKQTTVSLSEYSLNLKTDYNKIPALYEKVIDENPKLFYASSNTLSNYAYYSKEDKKSITTSIKITYLDVEQTQLDDMTAKLNNKILKSASKSKTPLS